VATLPVRHWLTPLLRMNCPLHFFNCTTSFVWVKWTSIQNVRLTQTFTNSYSTLSENHQYRTSDGSACGADRMYVSFRSYEWIARVWKYFITLNLTLQFVFTLTGSFNMHLNYSLNKEEIRLHIHSKKVRYFICIKDMAKMLPWRDHTVVSL
jgi:hypothetical protein